MGTDDSPIGRRDAIKKAAIGATAAGVVWSAPRIEGLSLRPAYAAATSTAAQSGNLAVSPLEFSPKTATFVCAPGASVTFTASLVTDSRASVNWAVNNTANCTVVANGLNLNGGWTPDQAPTPGTGGGPIIFDGGIIAPTITIGYSCS